MFKRVSGDWLHWSVNGTSVHFGFHRNGKCYRFFSLPEKTDYGNGLTFLSWWRLFVAWGR